MNGKGEKTYMQILAAKKAIREGVAAGPFAATWESLKGYSIPEWYKDAKFGIFIHWGAYSVPAFGNEWYPRNMYREGSEEYKHHIATYGRQDKFGYKDFLPMFKAEKRSEASELQSQSNLVCRLLL